MSLRLGRKVSNSGIAQRRNSCLPRLRRPRKKDVGQRGASFILDVGELYQPSHGKLRLDDRAVEGGDLYEESDVAGIGIFGVGIADEIQVGA